MQVLARIVMLVLLALGVVCVPYDTPLDVALALTEGTLIHSALHNFGNSDITFVTAGSIFDNRPVKKILMYGEDGNPLPFIGMQTNTKPMGRLVPIDFTTVHSGQILLAPTFDLKDLYDLTAQGTYTARVATVVWDAASIDYIPYKSNTIEVKIPVPKADSQPADLAPRQEGWVSQEKIKSTCNEEEQARILRSLNFCNMYAITGAHATWKNDTQDQLNELFGNGSLSEDEKSQIHDRLMAIAKECQQFYGPKVYIDCAHKDPKCDPDRMPLGYNNFVNSKPTIVMCPEGIKLPLDSTSVETLDLPGFLFAQHAGFSAVVGHGINTDEQDYFKAVVFNTSAALANAGNYRMLAQKLAALFNKYLDGKNGTEPWNEPEAFATTKGSTATASATAATGG